jgi:porphobilinogen deaminase
VLAGVGGGCQQPLGALAIRESDEQIYLRVAYIIGDRYIWVEDRNINDKILVDTILQKLI